MRKSRKKIFKRELILEKLTGTGEIAVEKLLGLFWSLYKFGSAMTLPYSQSYRSIRNLSSIEKPSFKIDLKTKVAFSSLLSKLEKENLIYKNSKNKIAITSKGKEYLKSKTKTLSWFKTYESIKTSNKNIFILVIFDIPEKERYKRDWLRFQLLSLGFNKLQQSVWLGDSSLPNDFIKDLENYHILSYMHILSINKKGTVSRFLEKIGEKDF